MTFGIRTMRNIFEYSIAFRTTLCEYCLILSFYAGCGGSVLNIISRALSQVNWTDWLMIYLWPAFSVIEAIWYPLLKMHF